MSAFWSGVRAAAKSFSSTFNGRPTPRPTRNGYIDPRAATPLQQAFAVGAVPGFPISNKHEELGHATSWTYIGAKTIAKMWGLSSWCAYSKSEGGPITKSHAGDAPAASRTPIHDHPALELLNNPNPLMGRMELLNLIGQHYAYTGGWIIWEVRDASGKPRHYWPIPRSWTWYQPPGPDHPMGSFLVYNPRGLAVYYGSSPLTGGFRLDLRDCIIGGDPHPQYPGEQISALTACSKIIDVMEQADNAILGSLLQAYHNGMILLIDPKTTGFVDEPQLRQMVSRLQDSKGGTENAGKIAVLQGVSSIERPSVPLSELSAVEVRNQNKDFGLAVQQVPSLAAGIQTDTGTYSGNAATFNAFAEWTVQYGLDLFASVLNRRNKRYWPDIELEGSAKRMDDPTLDQKRADQVYTAVKDGFCPPNRWLELMKLPPIPGGDEVRMPPQPAGPLTQNFNNGMPGDMGGGMDLGLGDEEGEDDLDIGLDLPDEEDSGFKRPELSRAGGRPFSLNGTH